MPSKKHPQPSPRGRHFVPASLLPYGGFGDPAVPAPFWESPKGVDSEKIVLSQAQDRLVRAIRSQLIDSGETEVQLEQRLGYRRYGLTRKLQGHELISMRDLLRLGPEFPEAMAALTDAPSSTGSATAVADRRPSYTSTTSASAPDADAIPHPDVHASISEATAALRSAARQLRRDEDDPSVSALADALEQLAKTATSIGKALATD